jgi:hypothetical protein
MTLEDL